MPQLIKTQNHYSNNWKNIIFLNHFKEVPAGRWKHDKFYETYGGAKGGAGKRQLGALGKRASATSLGGKSSGGIAARLARKAVAGGQKGMVKLQISNLPESVVTTDLEVNNFRLMHHIER